MWGFFIFNSEIFLYIYNMGCDIHMFAERYSTENNRWEKVGNEFIDFYATMTIPVDINKSIGVPLGTSKDILEKYLKSEEPNKDLLTRIMGYHFLVVWFGIFWAPVICIFSATG